MSLYDHLILWVSGDEGLLLPLWAMANNAEIQITYINSVVMPDPGESSEEEDEQEEDSSDDEDEEDA